MSKKRISRSESEKKRITESNRKIVEEGRINKIQRKDYMYSHQEIYEKALKELEERKVNK